MGEFVFVEIKSVESYFWSIVLLYCICNFELKKEKCTEIYMKNLGLSGFVLRSQVFPQYGHVCFQYLPRRYYFSKMIMNRLKMHLHAATGFPYNFVVFTKD